MPPSVFGLVAAALDWPGLRQRERGWARLIVEKPFGHDLASAIALNRELLCPEFRAETPALAASVSARPSSAGPDAAAPPTACTDSRPGTR